MDKFKEYIDGILKEKYLEKRYCSNFLEIKYTINQYDDGLWHVKCWYENKSYEVGKRKTLEEAKEIYKKHLGTICNKIKIELTKILTNLK